jgi:signal transduction histidine kinase
MLVPLLIREQPVGVLSLAASRSGRRYSRADLALAQELASRMSMAVENARLLQAAQTAIQKRDDFVSIASHELRTPLAALGLYLDGCLRELHRPAPAGQSVPVDRDKLQARLDRCHDQLDRLTRLVNDLLDVSRISAGRLELLCAETDLGQLTEEVLGRMREQAVEAGCPLRSEVEGEVVGLWDRTRLDEVITNLVANALKFGAGKPVTVSLSRRPAAAGAPPLVRLVVQDHGPGVRPEDRRRIFERFERTAEARNVGGIGLGLWIAHQIVQAHGGTIEVEGDPGQGARFVVELPVTPGV